MHSRILAPAVAGLLLAAAGTAAAETKTTSMTVSANVAANCVVGTQNLSFGDYDGAAQKTGSANVSVRCSNGTGYTVKLSTGTGTYTQRLLSDGNGNTLQYNLYTTSGYTSVFGDGSTGTLTRTGTGAGLSANNNATYTVHGLLPDNDANRDAPVGSYSDSVTVTVEY